MFDTPSLGVVMDPIAYIQPKKDTTLAILLEAERRNWQIHYLEMTDLFLKYGAAWGVSRSLRVFDSNDHWYDMNDPREHPLDQFDVILMRKDPPVDMQYIYATHILEHVESNGTLVINKPQSLRDINEKMYTTWFPQCMPATMVSASPPKIRQFMEEHPDIVLKPLAEMGGKNVFKCSVSDPNLTVILDNLTDNGSRYIMAQQFVPAVYEGDKRIFLLDGEPIPYALARVPKEGEFRGNLAAGGQGHGVRLTERDLWICEQVGPTLRDKGLLFVGLDVIGDYLTEINITSPTCVRELEAEYDVDIVGRFLDCITDKLED